MRKEITGRTPVTAKDIGRELGLSQPTVSRILAGEAGYRAAPETRKRVIDAAARMGYRPNALARSLRQRRTNVVGFYTGHNYLDVQNHFLASLIGGFQRAGDAYGLDILLHGVFRGRSSEDVYGELVDRRIDGLFVHTYEADPLLAHLRSSSLPIVAVTDAIRGIPSVVCDDGSGVRQLFDYLWAKGHRRIAYLRPTEQFSSVEARWSAFVAERERRGATAEECPVLDIEMEQAAQALPALRSMTPPPTAVCCWNDMAAYDLLHACRVAGIAVPGELSVVGFDGFLDPRMTPCPLVTISASWDAVAEQAMHTLIRQINEADDNPSDVRRAGTFREEESIISRLPVALVPGLTA
jgi:DNA-binding LacI/PurR family transcriptional regulator